jgi:hypothetical protein
MSVLEFNIQEIGRSAYEMAWRRYTESSHLSPDERENAPAKLHNYVRALVDAGERDPNKIAISVLGLMRQNEQITQSKARLG